MSASVVSAWAPWCVGLIVLITGHRGRRRLDSDGRRPGSITAGPGESTVHQVASPRRSRRARTFAMGAGLVAIAVVGGVVPATAFGIGLRAWPTLSRSIAARSEWAAIERTAPTAIELLVLVIRSGLTPHQAVGSMTTLAPEPARPGFAEVVRRLDRGLPLADALAGLPAVLGPSMTTVADTLAIAERHGTPIGDALTQLSMEVRQRRRRLAEASARRLPVRLSFPLVFCTLPSFVLVAIAPAVLAALSSLGSTSW